MVPPSRFLHRVLLFVLSGSFAPAALYAQSVQFVEETIEVHVRGDDCILEGTYSFRNRGASEAALTLFYPLLNSAELPLADSLRVLNVETGKGTPFSKVRNGILFRIRVPAHEERRYKVSYRQRAPARRMEYILTTTKNWGFPLERATFIITIPDFLQLTAISIPYDRVEKSRSEHTYYIHKSDFLPEQNLALRWRKRTP